MKIAVIGYSGSGKSTLSKALGAKFGVPILYLDTVHWMANWTEREEGEKERLVREFLDNHEGWVIDGTYSKLLFERRMEEAERIVILKLNRFACYRRAKRRYLAYRGKTRECMAEGCEEKFDFEFKSWLLWKGRTRAKRRLFSDTEKRYPEKSTVLKNQKQIDGFLKSLE